MVDADSIENVKVELPTMNGEAGLLKLTVTVYSSSTVVFA
jgi:hypothetical protein